LLITDLSCASMIVLAVPSLTSDGRRAASAWSRRRRATKPNKKDAKETQEI
jgi:hypothetical protein